MTKSPSIAVNFKRRLDRGAKVQERFDESITEVVFPGNPGQKNRIIDFSKFASNRPELTSAFEPHRVCRRLQLLRKWSHHEQDNEQVFT